MNISKCDKSQHAQTGGGLPSDWPGESKLQVYHSNKVKNSGSELEKEEVPSNAPEGLIGALVQVNWSDIPARRTDGDAESVF